MTVWPRRPWWQLAMDPVPRWAFWDRPGWITQQPWPPCERWPATFPAFSATKTPSIIGIPAVTTRKRYRL